MSTRIRNESGWAVATAIILMAVMLSVGLAAMAVVDNQQRQSGKERQRESALNLAEGAIYAQGVVLTQRWPTLSYQYPATCSSGSVTNQFCPNRDNLAAATSADPALANFGSADFLQSSNWITRVRDNGRMSATDAGLSTYYDPTRADLTQGNGSYSCPGPCTYDANGDHKIWVEASTSVRGRPRAVVAMLQLEQLTEDVPKVAMLAGKLVVSNSGNHGGTAIVDGSGSSIQVRCDPAQPSCADYRAGQVSPQPTQSGGAPNYMTAAQLQRLKNTAIANDTYYPGCPTPGGVNNRYNDNQYHLEGQVVWVDDCQSPPQLANKTYSVPCSPPDGLSPNCVNTPSSPGLLIWHKGVVNLSGSYTFCGLIYAVNDSDEEGTPAAVNGDVITTNGGFGVLGGIVVDGSGGLNLGSNGEQLKFDPNAFNAIQSYGTAGLVQNTWRELPPGSN
jgi:hypothetical protein